MKFSGHNRRQSSLSTARGNSKNRHRTKTTCRTSFGFSSPSIFTGIKKVSYAIYKLLKRLKLQRPLWLIHFQGYTGFYYSRIPCLCVYCSPSRSAWVLLFLSSWNLVKTNQSKVITGYRRADHSFEVCSRGKYRGRPVYYNRELTFTTDRSTGC